jgi:hypothetical protein
MTYVERLSEDGLSKVRFGFDLQGNRLQYVEHYRFHRDTVDELWGDEWPDALSYEKWCASHNLEPCHCNCEDECCCLYEQYEAYRKEMNPVCHKTQTGKVKMMGQWCMDNTRLPKCPDDVADEALANYAASLTVVWK